MEFSRALSFPYSFLDATVPFLVLLGADFEDITTNKDPNWVNKVPQPLSARAVMLLSHYHDSAALQHQANKDIKFRVKKLLEGEQSLHLPLYSNSLIPWVEEKIKKLILTSLPSNQFSRAREETSGSSAYFHGIRPPSALRVDVDHQ